MISAIFWNIRGLRSKQSNLRLKKLININRVAYVAIYEPFIDLRKINGYKRYFGFQHCMNNNNGQTWWFWNNGDHTQVISNTDQQLTLNLKDSPSDRGIFVTAVYANCTAVEREELWESIVSMNNIINGAWCMGGDFNIIMDPIEKLGGRPHRASKSLDFINCMDSCGLSDIGFIGPKFTWGNYRRPSKRI